MSASIVNAPQDKSTRNWPLAVIALVVAVASIIGIAFLLPVSGLCQTVSVNPNGAGSVHCAADTPYQAASIAAVVILLLLVVLFSFLIRVRAARGIAVAALVLLLIVSVGSVGYLALNGVG